MANYDYMCANDHLFERRCSIATKEAEPLIPCEECGQPAHQVIVNVPHFNDATQFINDYPGSKRLKAGHVHYACNPGVKKVSSGYGGTLNPSTSPRDPRAEVLAQGQWDRASKREY